MDSNSTPATPSMSPYMSAAMYALPPIDAISLSRGLEASQLARHAALPDILDPRTATNTPIRHVCCIGAGYVGK